MRVEIWSKSRVLGTIGMGNTWLYAAIKRGEFPPPVLLGTRSVGWRSTDVEAWMAARETKVA